MRTPKRVLVIGSGLAGLTAALQLAESKAVEVTLVSKAELGESNSRYAQGGIAAVLPEQSKRARRSAGDSVPAHVQDTLIAGAMLNNRLAVQQMCSAAYEVVNGLTSRGVSFDVTADGYWALGLEAAHSFPRILHSGGDSTGAGIIEALVELVRSVASPGRLELRENTTLLRLLTDSGTVKGAALRTATGEVENFLADAVILATGGGGQIYAHTTNPSGATADGLAAAWQAGAVLRDLEYYQFHPTLLDDPEPFMISEAVRGEGALLRNERGERFMTAVHPDAELAPRDVVSRGIARELAGGGKVFLDATGIASKDGPGFLSRRFPGIDAQLRARGWEWEREPLPVMPGAHYWMGGVATDLLGRSSVPGLYAVGEVACTGAHGANRLASNSLLEAAVFAARAATAIQTAIQSETGEEASDWPSFPAEGLRLRQGEQQVEREELSELMMAQAGVVRDAPGLELAAKQLAQWYSDDPQTAQLLTAAQLLVSAAVSHRGSVGAHWRSDYPEPLTAQSSAAGSIVNLAATDYPGTSRREATQ